MTSQPVRSGSERSFIGALSRSQVSAAIATAVDFGLLFSLVELFHVWYVLATASGALAGAVTNFLLNRHWSFAAADQPQGRQAFRYFWVSGTSMLLNTGGVWLFTDALGFHYQYSVIVVSALVGFLFNFPMHRYYVFKKEKPKGNPKGNL
jgi:putative flippase GtrA